MPAVQAVASRSTPRPIMQRHRAVATRHEQNRGGCGRHGRAGSGEAAAGARACRRCCAPGPAELRAVAHHDLWGVRGDHVVAHEGSDRSKVSVVVACREQHPDRPLFLFTNTRKGPAPCTGSPWGQRSPADRRQGVVHAARGVGSLAGNTASSPGKHDSGTGWLAMV
jgi:hypothetical protein